MSDNTPATSQAITDNQALLAKAAAVLMLLAMLTGILVASAMTGQLAANPHSMLASHVNAITGACWLGVLGWSLPWVRLGPAGLKRLTVLTMVPCYANWAVTLSKAFLGVVGVGLSKDPDNNLIFVLLGALVVGPAIAATATWSWALLRKGLVAAS
ncbi:MAG: hypothetical protein EXR77_11225 [Myxococcales bacterium]|nr:hypothetical protein [Myxococcales bacterium]